MTYTWGTHTMTGYVLEEEGVCIERRPLNPKTGKPWQASRLHAKFLGDGAKYAGLRAMLKIRDGKRGA